MICTHPYRRLGLLAVALVCLAAFSSAHALSVESVRQVVSLALHGSSTGGDEADYYPMYGEFDMGPVMTSDTRANGDGFTTMAAYQSFDGLGAVEAQYSDIATGSETSAYSDYIKRFVNDGEQPIDLLLQVDIQPGFLSIDNGGGTDMLPVHSSLAFAIGVSDPDFSHSQPSIVWSYGITLTGPASAPDTVVNFSDPLGLGIPGNTRGAANGSVTENIDAITLFVDLGTLQPGQDIAFGCYSQTRVVGNVAGGQSRLGDAFGLIAGDTGAMGNSCALAPVPVPPAAWLFGTALAALGWCRRRTGRSLA